MEFWAIEGIIKRHPDGFGFVVPDQADHADVYIPRQWMNGAMSNDRVRIEVYNKNHGKTKEKSKEERFFGKIIEILKRSTQKVIGRYHKLSETEGLLIDVESVWGSDIKVQIDSCQSHCPKENDLVVVEVLSYPESPQGFSGKLLEVIGSSLDPLTDTRKVLFNHQIPIDFQPESLELADQFSDDVLEPSKGRKDLRSLPLVTIDGATAKDFDDAVFVEQTHEGFRLIVAIADVSFYIKNNSVLDREARVRGNSTYFPGYVVPMLPSRLSEDLCSLRPKVPRLAFVCEIHFGFSGEKQSHQFYEALISSHARLTYGQAQEIVEEPESITIEMSNQWSEDVVQTVLRASDLAKVLMIKRMREGSLNLEIPETEILLDDAGQPIDIIKSERVFSHKIIEELMLVANVAAAEFFVEKESSAIFRVHEQPASDSIHLLKKFIAHFSGQKKLTGGVLQKRISKALIDLSGKPEAQVINILVLKAMKQAKYSQENIGHFGLNFPNYLHFTSPIRRYSDLIVHRELKKLLKIDQSSLMDKEELQEIAVTVSSTEQRSVKAERQFNAIKKARFMQQYLGEQFDAIVSGVSAMGIFVLLRAYDVSGLVKVEELPGRKFEYDEENLVLRETKTGFVFSIGKLVKVQVANIDVDNGQIDFRLTEVEGIEDLSQHQKVRENVKERGKAQSHRWGVRSARLSKRGRKTKSR